MTLSAAVGDTAMVEGCSGGGCSAAIGSYRPLRYTNWTLAMAVVSTTARLAAWSRDGLALGHTASDHACSMSEEFAWGGT